MHAGRQSLFVGDAAAQIPQLCSLLFIQRGAETLFVFGGDPRKLVQHLPSFLREMELVISAIFGAAPAFEDSLVFEVIDQAHHAAGHHAKVLGQSLLADAGIGCDLAQQSGIGRGQPNLRHPLTEAASGMRPQLRQEEGGSGRASVAPRPFISGSIFAGSPFLDSILVGSLLVGPTLAGSIFAHQNKSYHNVIICYINDYNM